MGINDDFSYIRTAQTFAQTGHFVYNGWATAMLGWQVPAAALLIKVFGFSFSVVRIFGLLIGLLTTYLLHADLSTTRLYVHDRHSRLFLSGPMSLLLFARAASRH
jgi:hypothetical protein